MSSEETEIRQLRRLFRDQWKLVLGPAALAAAATLALLGLAASPAYEATVLLAVHPFLVGDLPYNRSIRIQRSLIESDAVVQRTADALPTDGSGGEAAALSVGRQLSTRLLDMKDGAGLSPVLALTARAAAPERAAEIANAWARIAIEESRAMFARGAPGEKAWQEAMAARIGAAERRLAELEAARGQRPEPAGRPDPQAPEDLGASQPNQEIEIVRRHVQQLTNQMESRAIAGLLKREQPLTVIAPAVPPRAPEARRLPSRVATAAFLGGMLGLAIALARRPG